MIFVLCRISMKDIGTAYSAVYKMESVHDIEDNAINDMHKSKITNNLNLNIEIIQTIQTIL